MRERILTGWLYSAMAAALCGQETATLTGSVVDQTNALLDGVTVTVANPASGRRFETLTNRNGLYLFGSLLPGRYVVEAVKEGFRKRTAEVELGPRDRVSLQLPLDANSVTPGPGGPASIERGISSDAAVPGRAGHAFAEYLPLDGRSAARLVPLLMGASQAGATYTMVDGVNSTLFTPFDAVKELQVQLAPVTPEFGRTPGPQIAATTRAGSNDVHGWLFESVRASRFNANDWFANSAGLERAPMHFNQFGAAAGGAITRNRTFYLASYEGLRSAMPRTSISDVPTMAERSAAAPAVRPFLEAFPQPNLPGLHAASYANGLDRDSLSIRLDHRFSPAWSGFARYARTTSSSDERGGELLTPNVLTDSSGREQGFTSALVWTGAASLTNDLRLNYAKSRGRSYVSMDGFGGAAPLAGPPDFRLIVAGSAGYTTGGSFERVRETWNAVDSLTSVTGSHIYRIGFDVRRQSPAFRQPPYTQTAIFNGLSGRANSLLAGTAAAAVVSSNETSVDPLFWNAAFYAQDTWKASERTTFTYGLRYDVAPAPSTRRGPAPYALSGSGTSEVTQFEPVYPTSWTAISPRFGLSYQIDTTPGHEMMFRLGAGAVHDPTFGESVNVYDGAPFRNERIMTAAAFPLRSSDAAAPLLPPVEPFGQLTAGSVALVPPRVYEWNLSVERMFGAGQSLRVRYLGAKGQRLLRVESEPSLASAYTLLRLATNGGDSNYHAIQTEFRRTLRRDLQVLFRYTYSHAIDSVPRDITSRWRGFATLFGEERANSDFDVRHDLSASGSYRLPGGWYVDWFATARSGMPVDLHGISPETIEPQGAATDDEEAEAARRARYTLLRPEYNGSAAWIADPSAPGGMRPDPEAFFLPSENEHGTLSRNLLRGFGAWQVDLALRREIVLGERWRLNVAAQAFNVFNHASFDNPLFDGGANLASRGFGLSRSATAPRSAQLNLRVQF